MSNIHWPAVRAYYRAVGKLTPRTEEAEHALRRRIAPRFGLQGRQLWYMIATAELLQMDRAADAYWRYRLQVGGNPNPSALEIEMGMEPIETQH